MHAPWHNSFVLVHVKWNMIGTSSACCLRLLSFSEFIRWSEPLQHWICLARVNAFVFHSPFQKSMDWICSWQLCIQIHNLKIILFMFYSYYLNEKMRWECTCFDRQQVTIWQTIVLVCFIDKMERNRLWPLGYHSHVLSLHFDAMWALLHFGIGVSYGSSYYQTPFDSSHIPLVHLEFHHVF